MSTKLCEQCGEGLLGRPGKELCYRCLAAQALKFLDEPSPPSGLEPATLNESQFGDYEILEELARGGMGIVFKARQFSLNRIVALKLIPRGPLSSLRTEARFLAEIETAATLKHPNIVPILDTGTLDEMPFYTMTLIEGGSLSARTDWRFDRAGLRASIKCLIKVAKAVHFAHEHGIIHRDLKPSNVLLDGNGVPHVSDFGLAKRLDDKSELTISGEVLGTPAYMAPEQANGPQSQQTIAVDIYSLGAVLYYAITGKAPFQGNTALETLKQIESMDPTPPSKLKPSIDKDLETITLKALEKDPQHRYFTALALAEDLERLLEGEAILARRLSLMESARKWCRQKPYRALSIGIGIVVLSLFIVQFLWSAKRTEESRERFASLLGATRRVVADQYTKQGNTGAAIAYLSANLRDVSEAAPRFDYLASLLESREFSRPLGPEMSHLGEVWEVDFHPDGTRIATACYDGNGRIWSIETGQETIPSLQHEGKVYRVDFSADGKKILTGSLDGSARVWDTETGQAMSPPLRHGGGLQVAYFDSQGDRIISSGDDCVVRIWRSDGAGVPLFELRHPEENITIHIAELVPGKNQIITASVLGNIWVWDLQNGQILKEFKSGSNYISGVTFNHAGNQMALTGVPQVELWSVPDWKRTAQLPHQSSVGSVTFSANDNCLTTLSENDLVIWDPNSGWRITGIADVAHEKSRVRSMELNDSFVFFDHNTVFSYRSEPFQPVLPAIGTQVSIHDVHTDPERMRVAIVSRDHSVSVWEWPQEAEALPVFRTPSGKTVDQSSFTFSAEKGPMFLFSESTESSEIVSVALENPTTSMDRIDASGHVFELIPGNVDGTVMYKIGRSGALSVFEMESGNIHHIPGSRSYGEYSVDSKAQWAAIKAKEPLQLRFYSLVDARFVEPPIDLEKDFRFCQFSRDGKYLAAAADIDGVWVWRVVDHQLVGAMGSDWGKITSLDWGKILIILLVAVKTGCSVSLRWDQRFTLLGKRLCLEP